MQTLLTCGIATATRHEDPREIFLRNDAAKIADASDVKIPLEKLPVEDMDAVLSIAGSDAKVSGVIQGKTPDPSVSARVNGNGTNDHPFRVEFSDADLEWYPIK